MTTFKTDPIYIDDPVIIGDGDIKSPLPPGEPDVELLSIDVVLDDCRQLRLLRSRTSEVIESPYSFSVGCAQESFSTRLIFRGGQGSVTIVETSRVLRDDDGDGVIELELGSLREHTLIIQLRPAATGEQQGVVYPTVPTTKVVLRPDVNCPQPKLQP